MARSLNRAQLIGNLTRDPELRYTPNGTAVCSFGLATNRSWTTDTGEKKDEAEFHRIVAWNKLAELCSQFLTKGSKVFVEGRLATRTWNAQDGSPRNATEIIISDMLLLDSKKGREEEYVEPKESKPSPKAQKKSKDEEEKEPSKEASGEESDVSPEDIPF
ncbi:MAG: single-stranded DNA-binding protein [Candidatus Levybacteria bacterium]|nr:single-stranded DNA-binding protein [Candidatus Levybacteria bacterium]MBI2421083.1 single-stranded DNA-binding protein [Candidatus Levybacteria bacterium]